VGRAVSRINLSSAKVFAAGFFTFVGASILLIAGFTVFPNYINAVLGTMAFVVLILAYVFGRVALHVTFGKLIKKRFFSEHNRSEALTILFGVLFGRSPVRSIFVDFCITGSLFGRDRADIDGPVDNGLEYPLKNRIRFTDKSLHLNSNLRYKIYVLYSW
jgi:hypothetical protein